MKRLLCLAAAMGLVGSLRFVYQRDGFLGMYVGLWAEMMRAITFQALLMGTKEKVETPVTLLLSGGAAAVA